MSAIQRIASACNRVVTASLSRSGAHHGARSLSTSVKVSWLLLQPPVQLLEARSTTPWCRSSRTASVTNRPRIGAIGSSRNRGTSTSSTNSSMCSSWTLPRPDRRDVGDLLDHPPGVRGLAGPRRHPLGDLGDPTRSRMIVLVEEVLPHEVLESLAQLILAARDQRGVRDRQAQRVPEQCGHGEPVGHRADHARLGAGVDEAQPAVRPEGQQVDDGGEHQQGQGDGAHPAEPAAPGAASASGSGVIRGMVIAGDCVRRRHHARGRPPATWA